jgi:hypothetical protein
MGARTIEGLPATQKLHGQQTLTNSTKSGGTTIVLCGSLRHAVSGVLVQEKEDESKVIQQSVYYILEALAGAKLKYTEIKKIAYIVLISSRKLKHYFQAHEIIVPSS